MQHDRVYDVEHWYDYENVPHPIKEMETTYIMSVVSFLNLHRGQHSDQRAKVITLEKELLRRLKEKYDVA